MNKLNEPNCKKCGEKTILRYVKSSGMDIEPTGMFAECPRCGFSEQIKDLSDEKTPELTINSEDLKDKLKQ